MPSNALLMNPAPMPSLRNSMELSDRMGRTKMMQQDLDVRKARQKIDTLNSYIELYEKTEDEAAASEAIKQIDPEFKPPKTMSLKGRERTYSFPDGTTLTGDSKKIKEVLEEVGRAGTLESITSDPNMFQSFMVFAAQKGVGLTFPKADWEPLYDVKDNKVYNLPKAEARAKKAEDPKRFQTYDERTGNKKWEPKTREEQLQHEEDKEKIKNKYKEQKEWKPTTREDKLEYEEDKEKLKQKYKTEKETESPKQKRRLNLLEKEYEQNLKDTRDISVSPKDKEAARQKNEKIKKEIDELTGGAEKPEPKEKPSTAAKSPNEAVKRLAAVHAAIYKKGKDPMANPQVKAATESFLKQHPEMETVFLEELQKMGTPGKFDIRKPAPQVAAPAQQAPNALGQGMIPVNPNPETQVVPQGLPSMAPPGNALVRPSTLKTGPNYKIF